VRPLYVKQADNSLKNQGKRQTSIRPDMKSGYFVDATGEKLQAGGSRWPTDGTTTQRIFTEQKFREPFHPHLRVGLSCSRR